MKRIVVLALLVALTACGSRQVLRPQTGATLPPTPRGVAVAPTYDQLITPDTQARPQRSDELLRRSEERRDDPFELPPT